MVYDRFRKQLVQQLGFIRTSCDAYDRGDTGEAVRIGTSLRVLLHDTTRSTSLLTHLGAKQITLLSMAKVRESIGYGMAFDGLAGFSGQGIRPKLAATSTRIELPATDWWNQLVIGLGRGRNLSRAIIALTAANKDGGAHVDPDLPADYMTLVEGVWTDMRTGPVGDHHLLYLRQMGYEILNSTQLLDLAA